MKKKTKLNKKFFEQVDQQAHFLIAKTLNLVLPLANCQDKKVFNPRRDDDYINLLDLYQNSFRGSPHASF
jgi:hypothetical protein